MVGQKFSRWLIYFFTWGAWSYLVGKRGHSSPLCLFLWLLQEFQNGSSSPAGAYLDDRQLVAVEPLVSPFSKVTWRVRVEVSSGSLLPFPRELPRHSLC